tara:strand:- start:989 stop:1735 length:747 start_codon:yes stop_codon:yes gene_type:complete
MNTDLYWTVVNKLRSFFISKGFHDDVDRRRGNILAACEDPETIATYESNGKVWPLPQTGQLWLEHELLTNPLSIGYFCQSTSYRKEPNPVKGRHEDVFHMFEFEMHGGIEDLIKIELELCEYLELPQLEIGTYSDWARKFDVSKLNYEHEKQIGYGMITDFPKWESSFWNTSNKVDVILNGMETIGGAERSCDRDEMRSKFYNGVYDIHLIGRFGSKVERELERYLDHNFFPRCGAGIGVSRLMSCYN